MSIAVSAVVTPSRLLRRTLFAYALASAGAAIALASGAAGRFHFPVVLSALCALSALAAGRAAALSGTTRRIDISGLGEIRLTVQQSMGEALPRAQMQLLPGSTLWPHLLLLLLRQGRGGLTVLMILPDSVPHDQFRTIAVSARAIARRDKQFFEKHQIH